ncbi:FadR/GntR family transcriptional regulator [Pelosinus sp. sgz500959]|uniref:FadR/GntR family transcriptional regulator n=1 Tax=Pelosinus sp. sgz500959 TaxID=3242472 RepID=UPI00366AFF16
MFKPVKIKKIYEEVIEQVKKLIIDGKLQPGDKLLSERELAEKLGVSRASIREAFSALEMMGILTIRPGEGSFVRQVSYEGMFEPLSFLLQVDIDNVMQLLEVRKILEVEIATLAATRATPEDIELIRHALNNMVDEVNVGEIGDIADAEFHFAVVKAAHNPILMTLINTISELMANTVRFSRRKIFMVENMPTMLYDSHCLIFQAIVNKEPKKAGSLMYDHLTMVENIMLQLKSGGVTELTKLDSVSMDNEIKIDCGFPS